ncbi:MAG TPA: hypothetical protein VMG59_07780, partial [Phycisphaerae bacterium]|nr:hypothetical protein [Phycisphaerae bacterium]
PDATVYYHTGINTKKAQLPPAQPTWGHLSNQPVKVADDLDAIVQALGLESGTLDESHAGYVETKVDLPLVEY